MTQSPNPISLFQEWMTEAEKSEINDPTAMSLATATKDGIPSVRMVLLKGADEHGFVFYTNLSSRKAGELEENANVGLCLHWKSLRKQVRVEGIVERVCDEEADAYFQSRARVSRIGAWPSKQSAETEGRFELEKRVAEYTAEFGVGEIPRPDFWGGFLVRPRAIEFWSDQKFRLHDRIVYKMGENGWETTRLFP